MSLPRPPTLATAPMLGRQRALFSANAICSTLSRSTLSVTRAAPSALSPHRRCGNSSAKLQRLAPAQALPMAPVGYVPPLAMVNVDFSNPSLVLGIGLIGCGVVLLQLRSMQTRISRDADIVVAAMVSIVGSTLIFQGWRLDPLLLLCQALTTSVAVWYGFEAFQLRSATEEEFDEAEELLPPPRDGSGMKQGYDSASSDRPSQYAEPGAQQWSPGSQYAPQYNWQPQQWGAQQPRGSYLPPVQGGDMPWADNRAAQGGMQQGQPPPPWASTAEATIRYDYYGNPIQEPGTSYEPMYGEYEASQPESLYNYGVQGQYSAGGAGYYGAPPGGVSPSGQDQAGPNSGMGLDPMSAGQYTGWPSQSGRQNGGMAGAVAAGKALPPARVVEQVDDWE